MTKYKLTSDMEHRFEPQTKSSNCQWIVGFNAVVDCTNASPVFSGKPCIIVANKSRTLYKI